MTNTTSLWNDPELSSLRNELFGEEIPVDITFDGYLPSSTAASPSAASPSAVAPPAPVVPRYDSLAPFALAAAEPAVVAPQAAAPREPRRFGVTALVAVAAGLLGLAAGAFTVPRAMPAPAAAAAAIEVAPMTMLVADPAPAAELPAAKPIQARAAQPVKAAPRAAQPEAIAAEAPAAKAPAAPPVAAALAPRDVADAPVNAAPPSDLPSLGATIDAAAAQAPRELRPSEAAKALRVRAAGVRSCLGDHSDVAQVPVSVTFVPSGRVTTVRITGGPLLGTATGSCVAAALRSAVVPAFEGDAVTVNTNVSAR